MKSNGSTFFLTCIQFSNYEAIIWQTWKSKSMASEFALKCNIFFFYFKSSFGTAIDLFNQVQQMYQELMCKFVSPDT